MRWTAVIGGLVWILCGVSAAWGGGPFWILELLFLLAPLVLVPLALGIIETRVAGPRVVLMAALAATASFFLARGPGAAALAGVWLLMTLIVAERGLARWRNLERDAATVAVSMGMLFLPVGGGWLVLSRLGATPLGFQEPIVLLTAVHFHFAAFATLVLVGRMGPALTTSRTAYRAVVAGTIAGTPILAAGITLSRAVELAGAATLAVSLWTFAILGLTRVVPRSSGLSRALLTISFLSLFPSMALALLYAGGRAFDSPIAALGHLVLIHAPLNALGFALCGLVGWTALPSSAVPVKAP
jgi:YndJ-like protein